MILYYASDSDYGNHLIRAPDRQTAITIWKDAVSHITPVNGQKSYPERLFIILVKLNEEGLIDTQNKEHVAQVDGYLKAKE